MLFQNNLTQWRIINSLSKLKYWCNLKPFESSRFLSNWIEHEESRREQILIGSKRYWQHDKLYSIKQEGKKIKVIILSKRFTKYQAKMFKSKLISTIRKEMDEECSNSSFKTEQLCLFKLCSTIDGNESKIKESKILNFWVIMISFYFFIGY